jgi:hypothetical protein
MIDMQSDTLEEKKGKPKLYENLGIMIITFVMSIVLFVANLGLNEIINTGWYRKFMFPFGQICLLFAFISFLGIVHNLGFRLYKYFQSGGPISSGITNDSTFKKRIEKLGNIVLITIAVFTLLLALIALIYHFN